MPYNFYLGIDVSKASLSVVLMNSDSKVLWSSKKIANQPSGFKQMVEHASKIASKHADGDDYSIAAGMESTGVFYSRRNGVHRSIRGTALLLPRRQ